MNEITDEAYAITQATYNKVADVWHANHQSDDWWVGGTNHFISLFKPGSMILDVGCGAGTKAKYLSDRGLDVYGIDFSVEMINIAGKTCPSMYSRLMDFRDIKYLDFVCDGVFAQASLLHLRKSEFLDVLSNLVEKLVSGGFLYLAVKQMKDVDEELKVNAEGDIECKRLFSYYTLDEIKECFAGVGLQLVFELFVPVNNTVWLQVIGLK